MIKKNKQDNGIFLSIYARIDRETLRAKPLFKSGIVDPRGAQYYCRYGIRIEKAETN